MHKKNKKTTNITNVYVAVWSVFCVVRFVRVVLCVARCAVLVVCCGLFGGSCTLRVAHLMTHLLACRVLFVVCCMLLAVCGQLRVCCLLLVDLDVAGNVCNFCLNAAVERNN